MTAQTPLYYSEIFGVTGLSFYVGDVQLFAPCESDSVYPVPVGTPVVITSRVPPLMETFLKETVIEKRLHTMGARP